MKVMLKKVKMLKEEDEERRKKLKKKSFTPCDVTYGSVHMEAPRVHITAMSQGLTAQTLTCLSKT